MKTRDKLGKRGHALGTILWEDMKLARNASFSSGQSGTISDAIAIPKADGGTKSHVEME